MDQIFALLSKDARMTPEQIAVIVGLPAKEVRRIVEEAENQGIILGYKAIMDQEKTDKEKVSAFIEVKITPQKDIGFDQLAKQIARFPEVESVYLMSGAYDLAVLICASSLKEVSRFVFEQLATMEGVVSTATHFVLRKYKEQGVSFGKAHVDRREALNL